ncbi:GGDEF domain-containing protein [Luteimonas sp. 3794]|uniref:GGDEF domain-containing protein n=1 Tax=Luteimonas sp. 3794 TaxID=2817730 RepID=UPI002854491B|nr:GGDEF domain-containing protein [Luteimonas sp. 3794]MDR6991581.1 diguanylate cyclase (GGDEF)-like protein [Luteimonas sp. 3794]
MRAPHRTRQGVVATLLGRTDEVMLELGAGGELMVARVRALLSLLILLLPLIAAGGGHGTRTVVVGLALAVFGNLMAQVWLALARRQRRHAWLPYATGSYDVSMTTLVLVLVATREPAAALNSVMVWNFYMLAIALTALRNDGRLALYVGGLAIAQYAALVIALMTGTGEANPASLGYGVASVTGQVERLLLLAMMTVIACAIIYRMQRLVDLSGRDGLTGLPNRAWLLQHAPRQLADSRREGRSLTLGLLDLDGFRRINADAGPRAGDRAIRAVALRLQTMLEDDESLSRIGGQEFVLLLRCPVGSAWERLDRLRRDMANESLVVDRDGRPLPLRFSAGLAASPADGSDVSALLGVADRRLQQAKRAGRNRVEARDA